MILAAFAVRPVIILQTEALCSPALPCQFLTTLLFLLLELTQHASTFLVQTGITIANQNGWFPFPFPK